MKIETMLAQLGNRKDHTGAISFPVYHSATYSHPGLGRSTGYDYTRTKNPTRQVLEDAIASLEHGVKGFAFASGMAAITTLLTLFRQGDHLIVTEDSYGGTYRLFHQVFNEFGLEVSFVDTSEMEEIRGALRASTRGIFIETPTNPMMKIADIERISSWAKENNILLMVDNTFLTPVLQRPLDLGADIVIHSGTKYLGGHNDVLAGLVAVKEEKLAERFGLLQNALGAVLGPQDAWLLVRGMKTLALRLKTQEENARKIASWLKEHPMVGKVYYPGLKDHPGYDIQIRQAEGFGSMLSFTVRDMAVIPQVLERVKVISYAESLGGVESLMTYPATQTHADVPKEVRDRLGVTDCLLRLSVGIEDTEDLLADLNQALEIAEQG